MDIRILILAFALAACGQQAPAPPAQPEPADPFTLNIEIGRFGVMLDQVEALSDGRPGAGAPEVTDPGDLSRRLRETVWRYNLARSDLCARGLFREIACGPAYTPIWMSDTAAPTLDELRLRADAVGEEVAGFWGAVCADARTRAVDEDARALICAIE